MKRLFFSFGYAWKGIKAAIASEKNMQIHIAVALAVIILGVILRISTTEWLICMVCMGLVFCAEMFNTAMEKMVDMVSPEVQPMAGKIKDIAAGGVLLAATFSALAGIIIFLPKIL